MEYVGDLLGVDTRDVQETIHDYAAKQEEESVGLSWEPDGDGRTARVSEGCTEAELDSMFGSLGK